MSPMYQRDSVISTEDVHYGPLLPGERDLCLLGNVKDKRVLELASGAAQNSIALSKLGAKAVAIDVSPIQQEAARTHLEDEGITVDLVLNDAQKLCFTDNVFLSNIFMQVITSFISFVIFLVQIFKHQYFAKLRN